MLRGNSVLRGEFHVEGGISCQGGISVSRGEFRVKGGNSVTKGEFRDEGEFRVFTVNIGIFSFFSKML